MNSHLPPELVTKRNRLLMLLTSWKQVAVAFSGGVDSTVVAQAAQEALGKNALAVTAVSPSLAQGELDEACELAERIGITHRVIHTREFVVPQYRENSGDRCYFCKSELYLQIGTILEEVGQMVVCNGANLDDLGDHRPGMQAAREREVRSPLIEVGLNKAEVRQLARAWGLPVWDKPASPCLSSRIAYGVEVSEERVRRIDQAERFLKDLLDERVLRVRLEAGDLARIEVPVSSISKLVSEEVRSEIASRFRELGFRYITLDLEGFRSGSLNAALPVVEYHSRI